MFSTFWLANALRASGVPCLDIWTSKSAPSLPMFSTFRLASAPCPTAACHFLTSELEKVAPESTVLCILSCKCAWRHSHVRFFDIWTSKNGLKMQCFVHFDTQMCLAPERCAIFRHLNFEKWSALQHFVHFDMSMCLAPQPRTIVRHLNFKKCSETAVFCTFWPTNVLGARAVCELRKVLCPAAFCAFWHVNVLGATAVYHCSTSELQKVFWECGVLYILTYKCAWRQSGVRTSKSALPCGILCILTCQCAWRHSRVPLFDIWTSKSVLGMRCFVHFDLQMRLAPERCAILGLWIWKVVWDCCFVVIVTYTCASGQRGVRFFDLWTSKALRTWGVSYILTCTGASRHSGVPLFWTSKNGPTMSCFVHFDLHMCLAPERCAIFDIWTSKSGLRPSVFFLHFDLNTCFAPQRHAIFYLCAEQPAPHSPLCERTFWPSGTTNHWKTQRFATFLTFRAGVSSF